MPGPFYQASAEVPAYGAPGIADILLYNAMGLDANGIGNHEFDGGIDEFATMLSNADYPFLAVNLDFSNITLEPGTPAIQIGVDGASVVENAGKIAKSSWIRVGGERIGLIGRAPADFFNVIADPDSTLPGLDFFGGRDPKTNQPLVSAVEQVLEQVEILKAQGIDKIVLMDHAQDFTGDPLSAQELHDIDIIVAAGSTGFMAREVPIGPYNFLRAGDEPGANYPTIREDMNAEPVVVVNSDQLYRYLGNLIVGFDSKGLINFVDMRSGPIATTQEAVDALGTELGSSDPLEASAEVQEIWTNLQNTPLIQSQFEVVGMTEKPLNGERADVRFRETNLSRLVTDSTLWGAQRFLDGEGSEMKVDIALKNGGGIRDSIEGPNIIRLTIGAALAFDNKLSILELNAAELLASIENAVSRYPARDGRFPHLAGMTVEFDRERPGVPAEVELLRPSRVSKLVVHRADGTDEVIVEGFRFVGDPSSTFVMATNNFLLTGGDGYAALAAINDDPARPTMETTIGEQQILADYISDPLGGGR